MADNRLHSSSSGGVPVSDDFNTCALAEPDLWTYVNPTGDITKTLVGTHTPDAWIQFEVPPGVKHSMSDENTDAARLMQSVSDTDFEVEVKFESGVNDPSQIQGILVEENPENRFLRFDFHGDGEWTRIYAGSLSDDGSTRVLTALINTPTTITVNTAPLYLRINRTGDLWTESYSLDGLNWIEAISFTEEIIVESVGLLAGNTDDNPAHVALVDYFFNTASPISPEDGDDNSLTVIPDGNGSISVDPDQSTYDCGDQVTLTANPAPGWVFDSWGGGLTGSTNPATVTMNGRRVITATFTAIPHHLATHTVGSGSVSVSPGQPWYIYGDELTLTAVPDPGWAFDGWSGDLSGAANPETITISGDTTVTATFVMEEYIVTTATTGSGSVTVQPAKPVYYYGDQVILTATPGSGWYFFMWGGDLTGWTSPMTVDITGDTTILATFTQVDFQYRGFASVIANQSSTP